MKIISYLFRILCVLLLLLFNNTAKAQSDVHDLLGDAKNLALFAGQDIQTTSGMAIANGYAAANGSISSLVLAPKHLILPNGLCQSTDFLGRISDFEVYKGLAIERGELSSSLIGDEYESITQGGIIHGDADFNAPLTLEGDSNSVCFIYVEGNLTISSDAQINLKGILPRNVIFYVEGTIDIYSNAVLYGIIISSNTIRLDGEISGKVSLLAIENIDLQYQVNPQHFYSYQYLSGNGLHFLKKAANFALLASNINTDSTLIAYDRAGVLGNVNGIVRASANQVVINTSEVNAAMDNLTAAKNELNCLSGQPLSSLSDETLTPGVYALYGGISLNGVLTLEGDSNAIYIFNVDGDVSIEAYAVIKIGRVRPEHIYWNIDGQLLIDNNVIFNGIVLCQGNIQKKYIHYGQASLLTLADIELWGVDNEIGHNNFFAPVSYLYSPIKPTPPTVKYTATDTSVTLYWQGGSGSNLLIAIKDELGNSSPQNGHYYYDNPRFKQGYGFSDSSYVVYNGSLKTGKTTIIGLNAQTMYKVKLYSYNGYGQTTFYSDSASSKIVTTRPDYSKSPNGCLIPVNEKNFKSGQAASRLYGSSTSSCEEIMEYVPTPTTPIKTVRLIFHVFQDDQGNGNWNTSNLNELKGLIDGFNYNGNIHYTGVNEIFSNLWLHSPALNTPHIADSRIRFELVETFFYEDYNAWNQNAKNVNSKDFGQLYNEYIANPTKAHPYQLENAVHVFFTETPPMVGVAGVTDDVKKNKVSSNGCSYDVYEHQLFAGGQAKTSYNKAVVFTSGLYFSTYDHPEVGRFGACSNHRSSEYASWNLAHELGHLLGLEHVFSDMPNGAKARCNEQKYNDLLTWGPEKQTNNLMDYTESYALSACQIGLAHRTLIQGDWLTHVNPNSITEPLKQDFCSNDPTQPTVIQAGTTVTWSARKNLPGNLYVSAGATLVIKCQVGFTGHDSKIVVAQGGKLILDGATLGVAGNLAADCPGTVTLLIGGDPITDLNNTGLVVIKGKGVIIPPNLIMKLTERASLQIDQSAEITFQGGSLITEANSFFCLSSLAKLSYYSGGFLDVHPQTNTFISTLVPNRPTDCLNNNNCNLYTNTISSSNFRKTLCTGESVTLSSQYGRTQNVTFEWFDTNGNAYGTSREITVTPVSTATISTTVSYYVKITDNNCSQPVSTSTPLTFTINPRPIVYAGIDFPALTTEIEINLDNIPNITVPAPGTNGWTGPNPGQSNNNFGDYVKYTPLGFVFEARKAAKAGLSSVTLTYSIVQGGCAGRDDITISLPVNYPTNPLVTAGADFNLCVSEPGKKFHLYTIPNLMPLTGTWSGVDGLGNSVPILNGVELDLDLAAAAIGPQSSSIDYFLTYTYKENGNTIKDDVKVTINRGDKFTTPLVTLSNFCENDTDFPLPLVSVNGTLLPVDWKVKQGPAAAIFDHINTNASNYNFSPSIAGAGTYILTYEYTNQRGCTISKDLVITIDSELSKLDAGGDFTVCYGLAPFMLTDQTPSGGDWSGQGVRSDGWFDPGSANTGTHTLTYTVKNECGTASATRNITVISGDVANAGADATYCKSSVVSGGSNPNIIQLNGQPGGGTWSSVTNMPANALSPSGILNIEGLAPGVYSLVYTNNNLCQKTDQVKITIQNSGLAINMHQSFTACDAPYLLTGKGNGIGTETWSGPGIIYNATTGQYSFDPQGLAPGKDYTLLYSGTNPTGMSPCQSTVAVSVNISCCNYPTVYQKIGGNYINPIASAPDYEIGTANSITTIDASTYSNPTVTFDGQFHLKGHVLLKNGTFKLTPGTKFFADASSISINTCATVIADHIALNRIILEDATLIIDGATLQAACEDMWGGIWLRSNSFIKTLNGAKIKDAQIGILLKDCIYAYPFTSSSYYHIDGTYFINNEIGIQMDNMELTQLQQGIGLLNSTFNMDDLSLLKLPYYSKIQNGGAFLSGNLNELPVEGCTFTNLGIGLIGYNNTGAFKVDGNTFEHNWFSDLEVSGEGSSEITNNEILVSRKPGSTGFNETVDPNNKTHTAISVADYAVISNNTLTKTPKVSGLTDTDWIGIDIFDGHDTKLEKDNMITGFSEGLRLQPRNGVAGYTPPVVLGNSFVDNAIGVRIPGRSLTVAPILFINCNTFTQTGFLNGSVYGIYGDQGALFKINDPTAPTTSPATMKNNFVGSSSQFIHLYNYTSNPLLSYRTYSTGNSQTPINTITYSGNLNIVSGQAFDPNHNCLLDGGYSSGINKRVSKPGNSTSNIPPASISVLKGQYLAQNYPNPFETETTIQYSLPEGKEKGKLIVREVISGRIVLIQELKAKSGKAELRTNKLVSGVYVYTLEANGVPLASKKMIILQK